MKICPNCGKAVDYNQYFKTYICDDCGWEDRSNMTDSIQNTHNITDPVSLVLYTQIQKATGVINEYVTPVRLYDYEMVCGSVGDDSYPEYYEIPHENTGTLKDQGNWQACVACAVASVAEEIYRRNTGECAEMSEGFVYGALRDSNSTTSGMVVSKTLDYWRKIGIAKKVDFDYLTEMPEIKEMVDKCPELLDLAANFKISGYASIGYALKSKKDNAIKKALMENNYGVIAVSPNAFGAPHCIQLTGWDDSRNKYLFKNSWGESYGDNGFSAIDKDSISEAYVILNENATLPFTDVSEDRWSYKYIKNMYFNGLMNGTSDTTFEPEKPLTREEAATLLYRILKMYDERFSVLNKVINEKTGIAN